jgi:hypothetical protein
MEERNTAVDQRSIGIVNRPVASVLNSHKEQLLILRMFRRSIWGAFRTYLMLQDEDSTFF